MAKHKKESFFDVAERVALGVATGGLSEVARGGLSLARDFNRAPHGRLHPQRRHTRRKEAALHVPHPAALHGHKQGIGRERPNPHHQGTGRPKPAELYMESIPVPPGRLYAQRRHAAELHMESIPVPPGRLYAQRRHDARIRSRLQRVSRRAIE